LKTEEEKKRLFVWWHYPCFYTFPPCLCLCHFRALTLALALPDYDFCKNIRNQTQQSAEAQAYSIASYFPHCPAPDGFGGTAFLFLLRGLTLGLTFFCLFLLYHFT
jgi:hypothetical protein